MPQSTARQVGDDQVEPARRRAAPPTRPRRARTAPARGRAPTTTAAARSRRTAGRRSRRGRRAADAEQPRALAVPAGQQLADRVGAGEERVGVGQQHGGAVDPARAAARALPPCRARSGCSTRRCRSRSASAARTWSARWCALTAVRRTCGASRSSARSSRVRPPTVHSGLGRTSVSGRSRVPAPAASTTPTRSVTSATLSRAGNPVRAPHVLLDMPAVTVDDVLSLPRLPAPDLRRRPTGRSVR